jgi:hypothetical protein
LALFYVTHALIKTTYLNINKTLNKYKLLLEFSKELIKMFANYWLNKFFFKYFEIRHSFPFFPEANTNSGLELSFLINLAKLFDNNPKH